MKLLFGAAFLILIFNSCSKYEGEGGTATIKGVIREQKYNTLGNIIAEYPVGDQDVYIIYGNGNTFYDDDIKTSYDGSFEFRYLKKGLYKIFVYEDCLTCPSGKKEIIVPIEITKNNEIVTLDTINIKKI